MAPRRAAYLLVFFAIVSRISVVKKREKMPYALMGEILAGRLGLEGRSVTMTGSNVCADSSIGSSFGRLVPSGSVESPIVAMDRCNEVTCALIGALGVWKVGKKNCCLLTVTKETPCLVSWATFSAGGDTPIPLHSRRSSLDVLAQHVTIPNYG